MIKNYAPWNKVCYKYTYGTTGDGDGREGILLKQSLCWVTSIMRQRIRAWVTFSYDATRPEQEHHNESTPI